jgi:Phage integrase family
MFHLHYKPLWSAVGEPDNRFRKPAAPGRMIERVMLLDAVLDEPACTWLGPARDKRRHFVCHLESRLDGREYPHLTFGDGPETLQWDTAWRALRDGAGLHGLRFHDLRHTVITELAEMGVADHVLESISGHLSRRVLEHYSHIRIDAKRQALDALDAARRGAMGNGDSNGNGDGDGDGDGDGNGNGNGKDNTEASDEGEIDALVEVPDELTSRSRHSLRLSGSPPSGKLLIPLERRDVRVVEGARLEIESPRVY